MTAQSTAKRLPVVTLDIAIGIPEPVILGHQCIGLAERVLHSGECRASLAACTTYSIEGPHEV